MIPYKSHSLTVMPKTLAVRLEIMKAIRTLALQDDMRKFDPDQPRVSAGNPDGGQWTSGGSDEASANLEATTVQSIINRAKRLNVAARPDAYQQCLDLCYPLLERPRDHIRDRNQWDFQKCMNECLGRNL
jgi:hypothetical protein